MRVTLGPFARSGIETQLGTDLAETVETALRHYTGKLRSGRPPIPLPRFLGNRPSSIAAEDFEEIEVTLDSNSSAVLRREAMRQGIDVDTLATHSVMIYLAERDFLSTHSRPI